MNRAGQNRREAACQREPHQEVPPIPKQVGPCRFGRLGFWITVQCPPEFDDLMLEAGAVWEPRERRWLLRLHRLSRVLRKLTGRPERRSRHDSIDLDAAQ